MSEVSAEGEATPPAAEPARPDTPGTTAGDPPPAKQPAAKRPVRSGAAAARGTAARTTKATPAKSTSTRTTKSASGVRATSTPEEPAAASAASSAKPAKPAATKAASPRSTAAKPAAAKSTTRSTAKPTAAKSGSATPRKRPVKSTAAASAGKPANPPATEPEEAVEDAPPVDSVETTEASTLPEPEQPAAPAPDSTADAAPDEPSAEPATAIPVLELVGLTKRYGDFRAADDVTLSLDAGTFTGIVGPNGAGKTTTLSMITGLLRPTSGVVRVAGIDVWRDPVAAKRLIGVLPDRLHTFDRLTGGQLLYYTGVLHGLNRHTARQRTKELAEAFRVEHAMSRLVTDYSSGMLKKIALAAALIHAPRLLVLDEPFESVDPVSAMTVVQILRDYAAGGGTVLLSSHSMELVQRICDHVAVIVEGRLIAGGTVDEVRGDQSLQVRFIELAGSDAESIADLTWLHRFSS